MAHEHETTSDREDSADPGRAATVERYRAARRDPALAVLEGFHVLKHALRFGATILEAATADPGRLQRLAGRLAPELAAEHDAMAARIGAPLRIVDRQTLEAMVPHPPSTGVVAIARRPTVDTAAVLADPEPAPVVILERPRHLGNIGAAVRVAAAAGAAGLFTTGEHDPWHPAALRGGAGLQYALPVARLGAHAAGQIRDPAGSAGSAGSGASGAAEESGESGGSAGAVLAERLRAAARPIVAVHPDGEPLAAGTVPPRAALIFGSERHGLGAAMLDAADHRIRIPMRPGVSSLNLATAVAVVLYAGSAGACDPRNGSTSFPRLPRVPR